MLQDSTRLVENLPRSASDENPYEVPATEVQVAGARSDMVPRGVLLQASLVCIAGTTMSGAVFGTFLFPIIGTIFGFVLAFVTSIPISVVILSLVRLAHGPTIRKSKIVALSALCGGLSGFISAGGLAGFRFEAAGLGTFAGCFGALGASLATGIYLRMRTDSDAVRYTPSVWGDLDVTPTFSSESGF
ncbi:MAG: hypothetical protein U0936_16280 [Planctomycetaceae bacterium]